MSLPIQRPPDPGSGRRRWAAATVGGGVAVLVVALATGVPVLLDGGDDDPA